MIPVAPFVVIVDSREQLPYSFDNIKQRTRTGNVKLVVPTIVEALETGDYSIRGHERDIAIERKSLSDLFGCCGNDRERFENELERLANIRSAHLTIEATLGQIFSGPVVSKINRKAVVCSLLAWQARYHVHVWFAQHREGGEWLTYQILNRFHDDYVRREAGEVLGIGSGVMREHESRVKQHSQLCRAAAERESLIPAGVMTEWHA